MNQKLFAYIEEIKAIAGSLNHIVDNDGTFTMETIENMGDAHEALEECFNIIYELSGGEKLFVDSVCDKLKYPKITVPMISTRFDEVNRK